jgi:mRNA-degrading endonuclease RelE of RelBE toxin-antitoxin system
MIIDTTAWFDKQLKRLIKKYASMPADYRAFLESLDNDPNQGAPIRRGAHKIRIAIASKGQGKSGGARVITYIRTELDTIFLLDIYDKSEREDIPDGDLDDFVDFVNTIEA